MKKTKWNFEGFIQEPQIENLKWFKTKTQFDNYYYIHFPILYRETCVNVPYKKVKITIEEI